MLIPGPGNFPMSRVLGGETMLYYPDPSVIPGASCEQRRQAREGDKGSEGGATPLWPE